MAFSNVYDYEYKQLHKLIEFSGSELDDSENAHETFELELERALEAGCSVIVVEPSRLGDETARWIAVGNCLHKTAVLSGIGAIATGKYLIGGYSL